jgi:hypothetical protein
MINPYKTASGCEHDWKTPKEGKNDPPRRVCAKCGLRMVRVRVLDLNADKWIEDS